MALANLTLPSSESIIRVVPQLIGVLAALLALVTYRRNAKTKRAEWLSTLHAKFFEAANYKRIRSILDYEQPELETLREHVSSGTYDDLSELLVDYLNFFEFIASLWKLGQLDIEEVAILFEYYLNNLAAHEFIVDFIATYGFDNLKDLLASLPRLRKVVRA
jgi:hypothetical protein